MRWNNLPLLLALPVANALSLANFQEINSALIPQSCLQAYNSQIPSCTKSDFNDGCSAACVTALNSVAQSVTDACALIIVSPNTLLGIVKNGNIVTALCPTLAKTTTAIAHSTTAPVVVSSTAPAVSVTIPTDSQGVTGGLGFKTTKSTSATTSSSHQSSSSTSVIVKSTSTSTTSTSRSRSTSTESTTSSVSPTTISTTSSANGETQASSTPSITTTTSSSSKKGSVAAPTTVTTSKPAASPENRSGGGSPFDVQVQESRSSASQSRIGRDSILGMVVAVMVCIMTGR